MVPDDAVIKLHEIFRILIGDSADEWKFQKQSGSFETDDSWAEHLLAVHRNFCKTPACQLRLCSTSSPSSKVSGIIEPGQRISLPHCGKVYKPNTYFWPHNNISTQHAPRRPSPFVPTPKNKPESGQQDGREPVSSASVTHSPLNLKHIGNGNQSKILLDKIRPKTPEVSSKQENGLNLSKDHMIQQDLDTADQKPTKCGSRKWRRKNRHPTSTKSMMLNAIDDENDDDVIHQTPVKTQKVDVFNGVPTENNNTLHLKLETDTGDSCEMRLADESQMYGSYHDNQGHLQKQLSEEEVGDVDRKAADNYIDEIMEGSVWCSICKDEISANEYSEHVREHSVQLMQAHSMEPTQQHSTEHWQQHSMQHIHQHSLEHVPQNSMKQIQKHSTEETFNDDENFPKDLSCKTLKDVKKDKIETRILSPKSRHKSYLAMAKKIIALRTNSMNTYKQASIPVDEFIGQFNVPLTTSPSTSPNTSLKNFSCDICAKRFSSKRLLTVHMKSHSDERPHACSICGKTFKHSSHKRRHENQHFNRSSELPLVDQTDSFAEMISDSEHQPHNHDYTSSPTRYCHINEK